MKAVITIDNQEYLVPDAKKALALVDMLQKATPVNRVFQDGVYVPTYQVLDRSSIVEMKTLTSETVIRPAKAKK